MKHFVFLVVMIGLLPTVSEAVGKRVLTCFSKDQDYSISVDQDQKLGLFMDRRRGRSVDLQLKATETFRCPGCFRFSLTKEDGSARVYVLETRIKSGFGAGRTILSGDFSYRTRAQVILNKIEMECEFAPPRMPQ